MAEELRSCVLCRRRREALVETASRLFCPSCLSAVGRFAREGSRAARDVWRSVPSKPAGNWKPPPGGLTKLLEEEKNAVRLGGGLDEAMRSVEEDFSQFKADLEKTVMATDAETHLDLAIAYRELGLIDDSMAEAAISLLYGATTLRQRAREALKLLLDPEFLRHDIEETLALLRAALFPE